MYAIGENSPSVSGDSQLRVRRLLRCFVSMVLAPTDASTPAFERPASERDRAVLRSAVAVVDEPRQVGVTFPVACPDRLLERVQHERGRHPDRAAPTEGRAGVRVDHERHVAQPDQVRT